MRHFRIKIANQSFEVNAGYKGTSAWCHDFITDEQPDSVISMTQQDVLLEKVYFLNNQTNGSPSGSYLEFMALFRKISEIIIDYSTLLMHGAAIGINGVSYIFTAPSGTGKTTHILKWLEHCPDAFVINGDKPFLKFNNDCTVLVCGSPWAGKERMYTNSAIPLKSIILMERAEENKIEKIDYTDAFPFLFQQIYHSENEEKMYRTLQMLQSLQGDIGFYRFYCNNFKDDCFDVAYQTLMEEGE